LRLRAFEYLLVASADARSKLASQRAHGLGEQALEIATTNVERARAFEAMGQAAQDQYEGDEAWRCYRQAADARADEGATTDEERVQLAMTCARACEVPTRWPGSMRQVPDQSEVRRYLDLGLSLVPQSDNEPRARLLSSRAFWPWAYHETAVDPEGRASARAAGGEAADIAVRIGRNDLASGALDGVGAILMAEGLFQEAKKNAERRLELVPGIEDPLEIGDVHAVTAWAMVDLGLNRDAVAVGMEGYRRTVEHRAAAALHCLNWVAVARMRLGDWAGLDEDFETLRRLLGDRRDDPPYFASTAFAAAAVADDARGHRAPAVRLLEIVGGLRQETGRAQRGHAFAALLFGRHGEIERAWDASDYSITELASGPMPWEVRCDLVAVTETWDRTDEVVEAARSYAELSGAVGLLAFIDRLEGRRAIADADHHRAVEMLRNATDRFRELEFGWELALTRIDLGAALQAAGDLESARAELHEASAVFETLGALSELDRARELLSPSG
jgi:tetratricopeptide (TPR) repeat protein